MKQIDIGSLNEKPCDQKNDTQNFINLAKKQEYSEVKEKLGRWLPATDAERDPKKIAKKAKNKQ